MDGVLMNNDSYCAWNSYIWVRIVCRAWNS